MFLRKLFDYSKKAALLHIFAGCAKSPTVTAQDKGETGFSPFNDYALRELAQKKLHHGDNHFINPFTTRKHGNMLRVLHWKLFSENNFDCYYDQQQVVPVSIDWEPIRDSGDLSVTFLKHACVMIRDQGQIFLLDPVFSKIFPFIKDFTPLDFDPKKMPSPDHVLITHGHYDHLDTGSLSLLHRNSHIISPLGYDDVFTDLKMTNSSQLDWFDSFTDGVREITLLPCDHWTIRNPLIGPNRSLWGSYIFRTASGPTIFISGDTAYFDRFEEIGQKFSIGLAIINLGAYEPRWFMAGSHINPAETVQAFRELGAERLLIVHWGTFRLGDEPVHFPPIDIKREMEKAGLLHRLVHLDHGQTLFM